MLRLVYMAMVSMLLVLLALGTVAAQDDGGADAAGEHPEWEEWAFELDIVGEPGTLDFETLASAGQPYVLFFWLGDCPLCHLQLPNIQQLENTIRQYGLELTVVAVNVDGREVDVAELLDEYRADFTCLHDPRGRRTADAYRLEELGTPLTYLFDAEGLLVEYAAGYKRGYVQYVLDTFGIELPEDADAA